MTRSHYHFLLTLLGTTLIGADVVGGQPPVLPPPPPAPIVSTPAPVVPAYAPGPNLPLLPPNVVAGQPRPMSLQEFAKAFIPTPGTHEVVLLHPIKNNPMAVTFTLPPGNPTVRVHKREVVFDYGQRREVQIRFPLGGSVRVESR